MTVLAVLSIVAISAAGTLIAERIRFRRFWNRACTGPSWKISFPDASKAEIREFLNMFVVAFNFKAARKLRFEPADRVMEIYRTRYPTALWGDSLELETLAALAQRRYGLDLASFWQPNITLGELFDRARRRVA